MGKLYGEMTAEDWLRAKRFAPHEVPNTLIMVGEDWNPPERMTELEELLDVVIARPRWNVVVGDIGGKRIGLANVCWGPMAAMVAHQFFAMGTEQVLLAGYCGGLSAAVGYGQVLIVDAATGEDGASRAYALAADMQGDSELAARASTVLRRRGLLHVRGRVVTTDAMLLEDRATIDRWIASGFIGVDGETASVYAVAHHFKRRALALLTCSDLLVDGDSLYDLSSANAATCDETLDTLIEVAVELAGCCSVSTSAQRPVRGTTQERIEMAQLVSREPEHREDDA